MLKGIQRGLQLPNECMLPSFAGLRDYGNTSCSTTWYSLAYIESQLGVRKGEKVLQLGVGGGMKAGSNVWRAVRDVQVPHRAWQHLSSPVQEADLPRALEGDGEVRDDEMKAWAGERTAAATVGVPTEAA